MCRDSIFAMGWPEISHDASLVLVKKSEQKAHVACWCAAVCIKKQKQAKYPYFVGGYKYQQKQPSFFFFFWMLRAGRGWDWIGMRIKQDWVGGVGSRGDGDVGIGIGITPAPAIGDRGFVAVSSSYPRTPNPDLGPNPTLSSVLASPPPFG